MSHRRYTRIELGGKGDIENISGGGMLLRTTAPMTAGTQLVVTLAWSGETLHVGGRVLNVVSRDDGGHGIAIEFDALPEAMEQKLRALLDGLDQGRITDLVATAGPSTSHVHGLLEMLTDALQTIKQRDDEIAQLKAELRRLKK
jgi:PilZ domain-containing protein